MADLIRRAAVLVATVAVLAACGVPERGGPVVVGTPLPPGVNEEPDTDTGGAIDPSTKGDDPRGMVELFFHTPAAVDAGAMESQVRAFLTDRAKRRWQRGSGAVNVVRLSPLQRQTLAENQDRQPTQVRVTATVEIIGVLGDNGAFTPAKEPLRRFPLAVDAVMDSQPGSQRIWHVDNPPNGFWLSEDALRARFRPMPLYFFNDDGTLLVPELRYVPKTIIKQARRTLLVTWLLAGPSRWLQTAARNDFPRNTRLRGNVVFKPEQGVVIVDLTTEARSADPEKLSAQLSWTLRTLMPGPLVLQIDGRAVATRFGGQQSRDAYRARNAADGMPSPEGYYVSDERKVAPVSDGSLPAVLSGKENSSVEAAALSRDATQAMLVRRDDRGRLTLWLGEQAGESPLRYRQISGLVGRRSASRPSWISVGPNRGKVLVAVDGVLYSAEPRSAVPRSLGLTGVTAVSVSPEGSRVALVVNGRAYVAGLDADPGSMVGEMHWVASQVTGVTDVAWTREDTVVVSGRGPSPAGTVGGIWEATVDGAQIVRLPDVNPDVVAETVVPAHVAGYPDNPENGSQRGSVLFELGGLVYEAFSDRVAPPGGVESNPIPEGSAPFYRS